MCVWNAIVGTNLKNTITILVLHFKINFDKFNKVGYVRNYKNLETHICFVYHAMYKSGPL